MTMATRMTRRIVIGQVAIWILFAAFPKSFSASLSTPVEPQGRRNTRSRLFEVFPMTRLPLLKVWRTVTDFYMKAPG